MSPAAESKKSGTVWPLFLGGMALGAVLVAGAFSLRKGDPEEETKADEAAWSVAAEKSEAAVAAESDPGPEPGTRDDSRDGEVERGRELSKTICSGCHLYPEPALLDRANWALEVLPDMAIFMGLSDGDPYDELGAQQRVRDAGIIPTSPILESIEDWRAIVSYYLHEAPDVALPQPERAPIAIGLDAFEAVVPVQMQSPQTSLVRIDPERRALYVGEATTNTLAVFDAGLQRMGFLEFDSPPSDLILKEDILYVLQMGDLLPSDDLNGAISFVGRPGSSAPGGGGNFIKELPRPVDMEFVDLNGDGLEDIVVCGYGNILGSLLWFENKGSGKFEQHVIEERAGAIKVHVRDFNKDGRPDLFVMFAQSKEGIYIFENAGNGDFLMTPLVEKHPVWGNSWFELVDMDGDGDEDILATNGDNGDHVKYVPPFKNYHGVRIYLNDGKFNFTESWFFPINGAYKALARDFDQDGDLDIASIAYFADFRKSREESFVYFENQGGMNFVPATFKQTLAGRWLTMDAGDLDGDGDLDIVLGALNEGPSIVPAMLKQRWHESGPPFVLLKNRLK